MVRQLRRLAACELGATMVEAALTLPLLLSFCTGIMMVCWGAWTQNSLQYAVDSAARCAAIDSIRCGSTSQVQEFAVANAVSIPVTSSSFTVTSAACGKEVEVNYDFAESIFGMGLFSPTLTASACFPT